MDLTKYVGGEIMRIFIIIKNKNMFNIFEKMRDKKMDEKAEKAMYPEQKEASEQRESSSIILGEGNVLRGRWSGCEEGGRCKKFNIEEGTINGHKISGFFKVIYGYGTGLAGGGSGRKSHFYGADLYIDDHHLTEEEARDFSNRFGEYGAFDIGLEDKASKSVEKANADQAERDTRIEQQRRDEQAESEKNEQERKKEEDVKKSVSEKLDL